MLNYVINENTLAIVPYGLKKSIVLENDERYIVNRHPNGIVRQNCILYGSSLEEKLKKTELLTGYTYKAPIIIDFEKSLIFFPSSSPRLKECAWINPLMIKSYKFDEETSQCNIVFSNNESILVTVSGRIIDNQILRSTRLVTLYSIKSSNYHKNV